MSYHYKSACLAEILRYCKNDQILESCYQWQENVLRQEKYKNIAVNMIWDVDLSDQ